PKGGGGMTEPVVELADEEITGPLPVVAVVGRPNVGKSTLVNRILGRRQAVVEDVPGVTRDRVAYDALWSGRRFTVLDTGGWEPDARDRAAAIAAQAEAAVQLADVALFVVEARAGGGRPGRRHDRGPGGQPGRDRRRDVAAGGHGRPAPAGRAGQRHRVLREPAHGRRDRGGRGRGGAARRERADQRAGPADHLDGDRGRTGAGAGVQQVGPRGRGPPLRAGQGDRAR